MYSIKDIPGSVASVSGKVVQPVKDATGRVVAQLLLPPKMVAENDDDEDDDTEPET